MKKFQSIIQSYITNHEKHKKYLAGVLALSVLVSFGVSAGLIMPAVSMTEDDVVYYYNDNIKVLANNSDNMVSNMNDGQDGNDGYSKGELSEAALLMGNGHDWTEGLTSAEEVNMAARNKYFLGIASDFCIFLESDFTPKAADTEGRVAVGGDIIANGDYQIGAGDFGNGKVLDQTTNYLGITDFAHVIVGGKINGVAPFGTKDSGSQMIAAHGTDEEKEQNAYKRFVVPESFVLAGTQHKSDAGDSSEYQNNCTHWGTGENGATLDEKSQFYNTNNVINFETEFTYIRNQSEKLSGIKGIEIGSNDISENEIILDAGVGCTDKVVYFTIDADQVGDFANKTFRFKNIPEFPGTVKSEVEEGKIYDGEVVRTEFPQIANIVINVKGAKNEGERIEIGFGAKKNLVQMFINDIEVSNVGIHTESNQPWSNNHPYSENILWNFNEAQNIYVSANFNGTILAPNANIKSADSCEGHLSGSLIAKSFEGGLEFGYRPYRGTVDILPSSSGYGVPIKKVIEGGENLAGATFGLFEVGKDTPENTFKSDENGDGYMNINSKVDFTGGTEYTSGNNEITTDYIIKETEAPAGFIKDDSTTYNITVTETVGIDEGDIIEIDSKKIPTKVTTTITQGGESFTIELHDIYSYENGTYKRIRRELSSNGETFYIDLEDNGNIKYISHVTGSPLDEKLTKYVKTANTQTVYYYNDKNVDLPVYKLADEDNADEDKFVYKVPNDAGTYVIKDDDDNYTEINGKYLDENGADANLSDEDIEKLIEVKKKEEVDKEFTDEQLENVTTYNVAQIAWSTVNQTYPQIDKITFYYANKTKEELTNPTVTFRQYWSTVSIGDSKENVVGIKFEISGTGEENLWVQLPGEVNSESLSLASTEAGGNGTVAKAGTFRVGVTPDSELQETEEQETKTFKLTEKTSQDEPVTEAVELDIYPALLQGDACKTAQVISVNSKNYKYDPDTMMMMPQPSDTKTFTNKRGLRFGKVSLSGQTEAPLKDAKIDVKEVTVSGDSLVIGDTVSGLSDILKGDSETTIDLANIATGQLYCFKETEQLPGYELADPIYFKKSGNTIYYTQDADKAKSVTTNDWDSFEITNAENVIKMVDIRISGAKIKFSKWKNGNMLNTEDRLSATFQLKSGNNVIYPLPAKNNDGTENSFTILKDEDFDLYEMLKNADSDTYDENYIKNGYLKEGTYTLHEVTPPDGYISQDFNFKVIINGGGDYEIEETKSGTILGDPDDMRLGKDGSNPVLIITGRLLEIAKDNPDEAFVENLGTVNQVHVSKDGKDWAGNITIANKDSYTFKEILEAAENSQYSGAKTKDEIKFIRFMQWEHQDTPYSSATSKYLGGNNVNRIFVDADTDITFDVTFYYTNKSSVTKEGLNVVTEGENGFIEISGNLDPKNVKGIKIKPNGSYNGTIVIQKVGQGETGWDPILGTGWATNLSDLQQSGDGWYSAGTTTEYQGTSDDSNLLDAEVDGDTIKIPNQRAGAKTNITVEKKWEGDTGFESLRPESVSVKLMRKLPGGTVDENFTGAEYTVVLNSTGGWKHTWLDLPTFIDGGSSDDNSTWYKYYVVENDCPDYYESTSNEGISNLTVTNTLKTTSILGEKKWFESDGKTLATDTPSVTVQLQWKDKDSNIWADVPSYRDTDNNTTVSFTRVLNSFDGYSFTFSGLPENKDYQVIEKSVPSGWNNTQDGNSENDYVIKNERDTANLEVKKYWNDDDATDKRPNEIKIAVYRTTKIDNSNAGDSSNPGGEGNNTTNVPEPKPAPNFNPNNVSNLYPDYTGKDYDQTTDYARLMQYSMYFYDANMCGNVGNNVSYSASSSAKSAMEWRQNCHTYDDVVGGYHDAGDHVMFGLPQGFTASTLGWSYYEFSESFDSLGLTSHYQDIMKRFCDFFVASTQLSGNDVTKLLVEKGKGNTDHAYWGSPEAQPQDKRGGDTWVTDSGSNVAANYAAALAQYYMNFPDDSNRDEYLKYAKALYNFSTKHNGAYSVSFYADNECTSEQAWAAAWLYLATEDDSYKTACKERLTSVSDNRGHFWGDVMLGANTVYATLIDPTDTTIKSNVTDYFDGKCKGTNFVVFGDNWGSIRHNTLAQTVALIYDKHQTTKSYTDWCKGQMAYILGKNNVSSNGNSSTCFVTGFAPNSAINLHHRAASNLTAGEDWSAWNSWNGEYSTISGSHTIVGALVGGNGDNTIYQDNCKDPVGNEVALDYNAGLVAAAAGLYAAYGTGKTYSNVDEPAVASYSLTPDAEQILSDTAPVDDDVPEDILNGMTVQSDSTPVAIRAGELEAHEYKFNGETTQTGLGLKNVKKVAIEFNSQVNGNGMLKINDGAITLPGNVDAGQGSNNKWEISNGTRFAYSDVNIAEVNSFYFNIWWNQYSDNSGKIIFYCEPESFKITSNKDNLIVTENGDPITITANEAATWTASSNVVELTQSADGKSCEVRATGYTSDKVTITATSGGKSDTVEISVSAAAIQIVEGTGDIVSNIKLHKNSTKTVTVEPAGGDVSVEVSDDTVVTVTPETVSANVVCDSVALPTGRCNINSNNTLGDADITFTRNGKSKTLEVNVIDDLYIDGNRKMNKNSSQTLKAVNNVGNVWWEVIEGDEYIEIDCRTGEVTSKSTTDVNATVKAIDSDGKTATFTITIELTAVTPDIPVGKEFVETITLKPDNEWQYTLKDLPKTDANGNEYYYYIEEITNDSDNTIKGNGGSIYYPVKYDGNDLTLINGSGTISVTNEKKPETETPGYELPSTGGKGADWYYIIGAGLMSGAVVMFIRRRRRSA